MLDRIRGGRGLAPWLSALLLTLAPVYPGYAGAAEIVHVVARGQTLGRIAKRYHVSVEAIREANDLRPGQRIHPGLSLTIPEKGKEGGRRAADRAPGRPGKSVAMGDPQTLPEKGRDRGRKGRSARDLEETAFRGHHKKGYVRLIRGTDKLEIRTLTRRGRLAPTALAAFSRMLRFDPTGARIAIDPRLVALVGQVSDHFGGRPLHVVSGFRPYTPAQYTPHSNHNLGRAMDFSVEGVPNTVLRDFCKIFRNAGVGYYPNSSFVHLDVRTGKAYWVDFSHPGEAPHYDSPEGQKSADEAMGDVEGRATPAEVLGDDKEAPDPGHDGTHGSAPTPSRSPLTP